MLDPSLRSGPAGHHRDRIIALQQHESRPSARGARFHRRRSEIRLTLQLPSGYRLANEWDHFASCRGDRYYRFADKVLASSHDRDDDRRVLSRNCDAQNAVSALPGRTKLACFGTGW